ncbi:DUF6268 family outer membrane beta-barrel protein [Rhodoflexus caldus]|uniref:DUF6268 family outer membrane beta-barrel protein n=1 Tax=Rhodoflexus caldus TaxID=2891236 RepID=UPI00202A52B7|nr:DUF6268 family outer membrane beta-barrel protein [Rhodoflexus caldus]
MQFRISLLATQAARAVMLLVCFLFTVRLSMAQTDTTKVEDNFDEYGEYGDDESVKRYCTQKVQFLSPTKLISIGYELQLPQTIETTFKPFLAGIPGTVPSEGNRSASFLSHGLRLGANFPVISRSSIIVNLGVNYYESRMQFENEATVNNAMHRALQEKGLRTTGLMATVFKPLNEKNFVIVAANADLNGNYNFSDLQPLNTTRYSVLGIYGWKKSDKLMWGLGWARTYRLGEVNNTVPLLMYNRTFNDRWGIEALLPARLNVRRNFSPTSLLLLGYELEGNSYHIRSRASDPFSQRINGAEIRRSELKVRLTYEQQISGFIWLSAQAGLRMNANFNVSATENAPRREYIVENTLTNPLFFAFSINLVSP